MATGDKFVNIVQKRLMGYQSWKNYHLDYLKDKLFIPLFARVYTKDGTFGTNDLEIEAGTVDDSIKFSTSPSGSISGTDGSGHLLNVVGEGVPDYLFENATGNDYDVGNHYAERPSGVQTNVRTARPEYQRWQEEIGVADDPVSVTDQGGGVIRLRLPTSMCPADRTCAGRKCLVWMKVPADAALTEAIAIEELTVAFSTYNYIDTTSGSLGQTTIDTDETKYTVLLLGPTIARIGDLDIEAAANYWYIGEVTGNGPAATPTVFDMTDQRLITKSLSDLLENLVYDNVTNTFTRKQIFAPTVEVPEEAINATGYGAHPGGKSTGGNTNGRGWEGYGKGTAEGLYGKGGNSGGAGVVGEGGTGPGTGVLGKPGPANGTSGVAVHGDGTANGGGYGGYFQGKVVDPVKAAAAIVPQSNDPSALADGDHWQTTEDQQAKVRVNGTTRVYAEPQQVRTFLYPIACGQSESLGGNDEWYWDVATHRWLGNNNITPEEITFDLNRFIPQGATIKRLRAWFDPGTTRATKANRPRIFLYSFDSQGGSGNQHFLSCLADGTANAQWLDLIGGSHDGGDDQATVLTDSFQTWTVNELVGRTVYNLTDGSSGTITSNTATTATVSALTGGTDDDWDDDDIYTIAIDVVLGSDTRQYYCGIFSGNDVQIDNIYSLEVTYLENEYMRVP